VPRPCSKDFDQAQLDLQEDGIDPNKDGCHDVQILQRERQASKETTSFLVFCMFKEGGGHLNPYPLKMSPNFWINKVQHGLILTQGSVGRQDLH
jgi:hypothetical protein